MTILRYFKGMEVRPGEWVALRPMVGFAGQVGRVDGRSGRFIKISLVAEFSKGQVKFEPSRGHASSSIAFVCTTLEEANALADASSEFALKEIEIERRQSREAADRLLSAERDFLLNASVAEVTSPAQSLEVT